MRRYLTAAIGITALAVLSACSQEAAVVANPAHGGEHAVTELHSASGDHAINEGAERACCIGSKTRIAAVLMPIATDNLARSAETTAHERWRFKWRSKLVRPRAETRLVLSARKSS